MEGLPCFPLLPLFFRCFCCTTFYGVHFFPPKKGKPFFPQTVGAVAAPLVTWHFGDQNRVGLAWLICQMGRNPFPYYPWMVCLTTFNRFFSMVDVGISIIHECYGFDFLYLEICWIVGSVALRNQWWDDMRSLTPEMGILSWTNDQNEVVQSVIFEFIFVLWTEWWYNHGTMVLQTHKILECWHGLHVIPSICAQGLHMWMNFLLCIDVCVMFFKPCN